MEEIIPVPLLIAYCSVVTMAVIPIWIGAHISLNRKTGTIGPDGKEEKVESMKSKDAWMFPLVASCFLFGLYLLFKFINKDYINFLLNAYFLFFGMFSLLATFRPALQKAYDSISDIKLTSYKITVPFRKEEIEFSLLDILNLLITLGLIGWYVKTKNWIVSNILGLAFSIQGIALLGLPTFQVGCILLGGLFVYDIFWVFGTDVMVTVAKSFDAPIKLLFPKDIFAAEYQYSMLGLGDIVIPGVFLAMLLRYDAHRAGGHLDKPFKKTYFIVGFISYILGLGTTIFVMHTFKAAQPALLYLVPANIGAALLTAIVLGDLKGLFSYTEEEDDKKKND